LAELARNTLACHILSSSHISTLVRLWPSLCDDLSSTLTLLFRVGQALAEPLRWPHSTSPSLRARPPFRGGQTSVEPHDDLYCFWTWTWTWTWVEAAYQGAVHDAQEDRSRFGSNPRLTALCQSFSPCPISVKIVVLRRAERYICLKRCTCMSDLRSQKRPIHMLCMMYPNAMVPI
jgi:hypothetical protein